MAAGMRCKIIRRWSTPAHPHLITAKCLEFDCFGREGPPYGRQIKITTYPKEFVPFQDFRQLQHIKDGCCPPQIEEDKIRKERFEDQDEDAAMEAIRLHKRGYFGGGG